jgi:hypothetical protein
MVGSEQAHFAQAGEGAAHDRRSRSSLCTMDPRVSVRKDLGQPVGPLAASSDGGDIRADPSAASPVRLSSAASWCSLLMPFSA